MHACVRSTSYDGPTAVQCVVLSVSAFFMWILAVPLLAFATAPAQSDQPQTDDSGIEP